jgi:DNA-binding CsgD family transcriptional regulator
MTAHFPTIPHSQKLTHRQSQAASGSLVGAAVADALGAPFEFQAPGTYVRTFPSPVRGGRGEMIGGGTFNWAPGEFTDDTQMALSLAEALLASGLEFHPETTWNYFRAWSAQAKDIGNTIRGPVRRDCALAKHASGDTPGAIDDLLIARNESRRIGDHLWDLACSVDIVEILAESDPARAIELVPESLIIEAEASEMKWRALRGRVALTKARTALASDLGLTPRQIKVMQGLLQNLTIIEIATSLGFSHSTVRQESIAIYKALNIEGRTAIAERARELRLV